VHASFARLGQCLAQDSLADARDLDVHLQGRDAALRPGHLKVHVAQVIFHALDVRQHGVALALFDQAHGDARHRADQRDARRHQRQGAAAHAGHARAAVGRHHFADDANRVGELVFGRDHRPQRRLRQRAVPDLAALGAAQEPRFAGAVGREVVMVHVALGVFRVQPIQRLAVARGAQRADAQHLRLAALEQAGAVHARDQVHFGGQRADRRVVAPVGAHAVFEDAPAHFLFQRGVERLADALHRDRLLFTGGANGLILGQQALAQLVNGRVTLRPLGGAGQDARDVSSDLALDLGGQRLVHHCRGVRALGLAHLLAHLVLRRDQALHGFVPEAQRADHRLFVHLVGPGLDHDDRFAGAGHAQVEQAVLHLRDGRVEHELTVNEADAHRANRPAPGHIRDVQRGAGRDDREYVRVVFLVVAERRDDDLHLVAQVFGEERAQRAVGDAGDEDARLRRTPFAAHEAAGDAARRVELFFVVYAEREEVNAFAGSGAHGRCGEDDGIAQADGDCATGLLGQLARLQDEFLVADHRHKTLVGRHSG